METPRQDASAAGNSELQFGDATGKGKPGAELSSALLAHAGQSATAKA